MALGATGGATSAELGTAQDDWWPALALIALAALMAEWLLYERDGARRIWAGLRSRWPGRRRGAGTQNPTSAAPDRR